MKRYLYDYKFSMIVVAVVLYLSFFTPPQTGLDEISNFDKFAHICMYGGLCCIIWIEYFLKHQTISLKHIFVGAIILPILLSGIIEVLQEYCTANRSGDWLDLLANSIGVFLAAIINYFGVSKLFMKKK